MLRRGEHREAKREESDSLVTVLRPRTQGTLALAKSRLDAADIRYWVRNEITQDLFGWGRLGTGWNYVTGWAESMVDRADAETAAELLADLAGAAPPRIPLIARMGLLVLLAGVVYLAVISWLR